MFWLGPPTVSRFWPNSQEKNENRIFDPSAKSCRELELRSSGVIYRDGAASNTQKNVAPPKRAIFDLMLHLWSENFIKKNFFGVEKSNVGNRPKRVLAKFRADRSHPRRVNGRTKK